MSASGSPGDESRSVDEYLHVEPSGSNPNVAAQTSVVSSQWEERNDLVVAGNGPIVRSSLASVGVAILNCGWKCREESSQMAIIGVITNACPNLGLIFLSEVDFKRSNVRPFAVMGHRCHRHWPGDGSTPMMFVMNTKLCKYAQPISWRCRCGAVHLLQNKLGDIQFNLYVVGVHGQQGELHSDTLADVAFLLRLRPWGARLAAGD